MGRWRGEGVYAVHDKSGAVYLSSSTEKAGRARRFVRISKRSKPCLATLQETADKINGGVIDFDEGVDFLKLTFDVEKVKR